MQAEDVKTAVRLPGFVFDRARAELRDLRGRPIDLRPQCLSVLQCLAGKPGEVVTKDELMRTVWRGVVVTDDSLVQCVKELRRALGDDGHRTVQTVARRGYRLIELPGSSERSRVEVGSGCDQVIRFATTADGVRLAYATWGDGPPLVRATFWVSHLEHDWRGPMGPRLRRYSERYRFVRYDMRGCGLSDRDIDPGNLDMQVEDLRAVADAAGLTRFRLLGHSAGSPIALRFAARYPERVSHLLIVGGFVRGALRSGNSAAMERWRAVINLIEAGWSNENPAYRQLFTSLNFPGATAEEARLNNELQRHAATPAQVVKVLRAMADWDASDDLPLVRSPTLVMHALKDAAMPYENGRLIAASIPGARFETIDSINHMPLVHEPAFEAFHRTVDAFFDTPSDARVHPPAPKPARGPRLRLVPGMRQEDGRSN